MTGAIIRQPHLVGVVAVVKIVKESHYFSCGSMSKRLSSYGVVRRNGQEEMVIIDFGLTEDVFNNYYRKSRE